jgi:hypothetical protein
MPITVLDVAVKLATGSADRAAKAPVASRIFMPSFNEQNVIHIYVIICAAWFSRHG